MIYRKAISEEVHTFKNIKASNIKDTLANNLNKHMSGGDQGLAFPSGNAFESMARTNPEYFNNAKLKELQASTNLVHDFNEYFKSIILGDIKKFNDKYGEFHLPDDDDAGEFNTTIHRMIISQYRMLKMSGVSEDEVVKCITEQYIPESLTEKGCRALINIRINNSRLLTDSLTKMLRHNYQALGISLAEAKHLIFELNQDSINSKAIGKIKEMLKDPNKLKRFKMDEYNYDFRSIGGACIFLSQDPSIQFSQHPSKRLMDIFKYDAIVTAHGSYIDNNRSGNIVQKIKDGSSRDWVCQPVSTLKASNLTTIVDILRALKKEGFKNVYVGACNPGSVQLPKDIIMDKSFKVTMGLQSVYLENNLVNDPIYQDICTLEHRLNDMSDEYGGEYSNFSLNELYTEYDNIESILNEGVIEAIKQFAKKAVSIIIEIWRHIVAFFKSIYTKISVSIKEKFGNNYNSKTPKPISINVISMVGNGTSTIDKYTANTPDDIKNIVQKANMSISNRIKHHSTIETSYIRKLEQLASSGKLIKNSSKINKESTIFKSIQFI